MAKTPVTVAGAEMLRIELHRLKTVDRPKAITAIAEARSHGDLSENAEYDAAKERQSFLEGRIAEVESRLANAQIIDPKLLDAEGRCVFGSTVDLQDLNSNEAVTYQIVGEDEADIRNGRLSVTSPLARALIGKGKGDNVEVQITGDSAMIMQFATLLNNPGIAGAMGKIIRVGSQRAIQTNEGDINMVVANKFLVTVQGSADAASKLAYAQAVNVDKLSKM